MKAPHLLRVDQEPAAFAPLLAALHQHGLRAGWLDLGGVTSPLPPALAAAAGLGALRAVAVTPECSVAVKPRHGQPVLRDLLREHFLGCAVVLVRGDVEAPLLSPAPDSWQLSPPASPSQRLSAAELAAALRRPHPWG